MLPHCCGCFDTDPVVANDSSLFSDCNSCSAPILKNEFE
jgi:hypothetical protein